MRARGRELERLDAFLNRARSYRLHLLQSMLWLRGTESSARQPILPAAARPGPARPALARPQAPGHRSSSHP